MKDTLWEDYDVSKGAVAIDVVSHIRLACITTKKRESTIVNPQKHFTNFDTRHIVLCDLILQS